MPSSIYQNLVRKRRKLMPKNKKKQICPECKGSGVRLLPILLPGGMPVKTELVCVECKGLGEIKND